MILILSVAVILIISVIWAIISLKQLSKMEKVTAAKDELKKGKVIFQSDSEASLSSESSSAS